jgi:hypothetical protein
MVGDESLPAKFRRRALLLIKHHGGDHHFRQLMPVVAKITGPAREEQQLRASLTLMLLERGLWSVLDVVPFLTQPEPDIVDDWQMLLRQIKERMSVADARNLLQGRARYRSALDLPTGSYDRYKTLLDLTLSKLLAQNPLSDEDALLLCEATLERAGSGSD